MHDLRIAFRTLRATPIVSAVAVLSLALGIGANSAVFALVDSLVLRRLPVVEPDRLVLVSTGPGDDHQQYSHRTLDAIRRYATGVDGVSAWAFPARGTIGTGAGAHAIDRQFVSGDYFSMLGVRPAIGRLITPSDDVRDGGPDGLVAVLSYPFWQTYFAGSPAVVGSRILFERVPVTVVGVTPPGFRGVIVGGSFDVAVPARAQPSLMPSTPYPDDGVWLRIMLRLKRGQSIAEATAAIRAAQPAIRADSAPRSAGARRTFMQAPFVLEPAASGVSPLRDRFERPLLILLAVVGLVLLIACANVANLMLARGAARRHEMAVRMALGASRWRLARQLFTEGAILSAAGAAVALLFAGWVGRAIVARLSTFMLPIALDVGADWRMLAFTATTMIATTLLFGMAPARRAGSVAPAAVIQASDRQRGAGASESRLSIALIVLQVAVSLTLVVTAALLVRSFERLAATPLGFERSGALAVTVASPTVPAADRGALYRRLVEAASRVPGVASAGGSMNPPIAGTLIGNFVVSDPGVAAPLDAEPFSQSDWITPGFIAAYGMTLQAGRDFEDRDLVDARPAIIVNDAFVRRYVRGDPIGRAIDLTYRMASQGDYSLGTKTIVGVVSDSVYRSMRDRGRPTLYLPLTNEPILQSSFYVAVRAVAGSPLLLTRQLSGAMLAVNAELTLTPRPIGEQVDAALAQDRLVASLAAFFGALAVLLAALGLYGMTAYSVARRRTELGIRMALGADRADIVRIVLGRVVAIVVLGTAAGIGGAYVAGRVVASLLYGVDAHDPATFAAAATSLAAVSGLAAYVPARRASSIEPAEVLREG